MAKAKSPNSTATSTNGDARTNGTVTVSKKKSTVSELQTSSAPDSNATNGNAPRSRSTDTSVYPSVSEEKSASALMSFTCSGAASTAAIRTTGTVQKQSYADADKSEVRLQKV